MINIYLVGYSIIWPFIFTCLESKRKKAKNWAEDDYYDSDDDTFLDRTGEIEKKREARMKKAGVIKQEVETFASLVGIIVLCPKQWWIENTKCEEIFCGVGFSHLLKVSFPKPHHPLNFKGPFCDSNMLICYGIVQEI